MSHFNEDDVSGSGSDTSFDGDLGDESGDDENGAGDREAQTLWIATAMTTR